MGFAALSIDTLQRLTKNLATQHMGGGGLLEAYASSSRDISASQELTLKVKCTGVILEIFFKLRD